MAFPSSPSNGQTYSVGGVTYVYNSTKGVWQIQTYDTVDPSTALAEIKTVDGAGSGLDADLLDGLSSADYWKKTDGVNATTLDGIDSNRIIYGDNSTGTTSITEAQANGSLKSGFYNPDLIAVTGTTQNFMVHSSYDGIGNLAGMDLLSGDYRNGHLYFRNATGSGKGSWHKIWHSGVDGAGSGLDADTLDGLQASAFTQTINGAINLPTGSSDPASTTTGAIYYNTADATIKQYTGSEWVAVYQKPDGTTMNLAVDKSTDIPQGYPTGWYWINVDGTPQQFWVDMDYDGGGWVLVATHTSGISIANATYAETTTGSSYVCKSTFTTGTTDPRTTTVLLPLSIWPKLCSQNGSTYKCMQHVYTSNGVGPAYSTYRSRWTWTGFAAAYGWQGGGNLVNEVGGLSPGVYGSHVTAGSNWTTYDVDQDTYGSNCATLYGNQPFWYNACWNGNWFAGGSYQNRWYWEGSGSNHHAYGAAYVK